MMIQYSHVVFQYQNLYTFYNHVDSKNISTANVDEDYKKVKWPRAELGYVSAFLWMLKQGDNCEYPLPRMKLQLDILQHVQAFTGLSYMGPNSFYEALTRLVEAIDTEANLKSSIQFESID
jgi:hypothetical protein